MVVGYVCVYLDVDNGVDREGEEPGVRCEV